MAKGQRWHDIFCPLKVWHLHMLAFQYMLAFENAALEALLFCSAHQRLRIGAMYRSTATVWFDHVFIVTNNVGCCSRVRPACFDSNRRKLCQYTLSASALHRSERAHATSNDRAFLRPSRHSRQASNTCRFATASNVMQKPQSPLR